MSFNGIMCIIKDVYIESCIYVLGIIQQISRGPVRGHCIHQMSSNLRSIAYDLHYCPGSKNYRRQNKMTFSPELYILTRLLIVILLKRLFYITRFILFSNGCKYVFMPLTKLIQHGND
jgi:hypothetical protein